MGDSYDLLLDAALEYLQTLKAQGEHWITLGPESRAWLASARSPALTAVRAPAAIVTAREPAPTPAPPPPPLRTVSARTETPVTANAASSMPPVNAATRAEALAELRSRVLPCRLCPHLAASRKNVVFGVGDPNASLMFVGEAPGADEDKQGEPFVGAAGQLLSRIIKTMGFSRETVYIANVLKCRPDTPGQAFGNRKPSVDEMKTCLPYLLEQIRMIQPKVIVALGATAMEGLFGRPTPISKARGHWHTFDQTPVMPTYHPSYLLRNQAPTVKREVWEDMLQVMERLEVPISEKQRNYFK